MDDKTFAPEIQAHLKVPAREMLQQLDPKDFMMYPMHYQNPACSLLEARKQQQRRSLITLLEGARPTPAQLAHLSGEANAPLVEKALAGWVSNEGTARDVHVLMLMSLYTVQ